MRPLFAGFIFGTVTVTLALAIQVFANTTPCKNYPIGQSTGLSLHLRHVNSAQFSPDGNSVVTALGDGAVRFTPLFKACVDSSLKVATSINLGS